MNTISAPSSIRYCQVTRMGMLALTGMLFTACAGGQADRSDAVKIADGLKGKTKQDILTCAGVPRREGTSQGLTAMVYQEPISSNSPSLT